jgi:hypothetical protein
MPGVQLLKFRALSLFVFALACAAADQPALAPETIVQNYCAAQEAARQAAQRQAPSGKSMSMDVDIQASLPGLKKQGRLHGLRKITVLGRITYAKLIFEGDNTVKNQVIERYLTAEAEAQHDEPAALAVVPANYKFQYKGQNQADGRAVHVFQVTPKRKRQGLFKGEVWIDAATYLPIQESGYLIKSPSILVKRVAFVRKFEIRDGVSVPRQVQSTVDTRLFGKAELTVDFSNFSLDEGDSDYR